MIYENPDIESSFKENDLGQTLYDLVLDIKPKKIIEFGALNGYSTVAMAMALQKLGRGVIQSHDLWDTYEFKNATKRETIFNVKAYGVEEYVEFYYSDFWKWKPEKCDIFYIDISNDGDIIERAYEKMKDYADYIVFEGGSVERDNVEWMTKYNKKKISECSVKYDIINNDFPSISIYQKN